MDSDRGVALFCNSEIFQMRQYAPYVSATKLVVLPKAPHPQSTIEFLPISWSNVIYKGIFKLLSTQIKEVLPHIISQNQAAFVRGRELLYNVLICQDVAHRYQRMHVSPCCLFKIDLQKAFNFIHWEFIHEMLIALKFPQLFVNWVMACVTPV